MIATRAPRGIVLEAVSRSFGDKVAVDDVSFRVEPGEIVGLLGPNGAGKTTTLRMLATLLAPDAGKIFVAGHSTAVQPRAVRASLGYQTAETGLYARLTPRELLVYFAKLGDLRSDDLDTLVTQTLTRFGAAEFADQRCGTLSTGQKQRVSLARAMLHSPPVVVLDEPTSGLDIVSSQFVLEGLQQARGEDRAVLFSTHILSEVELVCDRVLLMNEGRIVARGTVDELIEQTGETSFTRAFLAHLTAEAQR